jgi:hypothetical protein
LTARWTAERASMASNHVSTLGYSAWSAALGRAAPWPDGHVGDGIVTKLIALADIDPVHGIIETAFFQHDVDFVAVRRRPCIEIDHRFLRYSSIIDDDRGQVR